MPDRLTARIGDSWRRIRASGLFQFTAFLLLILASRSALADWNFVPSGSMKPTILEGELIFVDRLAYDLKVPFTRVRIASWDDPVRGDIVIARSPETGERIVKRVVGLPGDRIELEGQVVRVNGEAPQLAPLSELELSDRALSTDDLRTHVLARESVLGSERTVMVGRAPKSLPQSGVFEVPPGHFFLMGDHRNNSRDSRFYGPVPRRDILGQARLVLGSVDVEDGFTPRWKRFFASTD